MHRHLNFIIMEELEATPEALSMYIDECAMLCDKAEAILREQKDPSAITPMAREVLRYVQHLVQFDHLLPEAYTKADRMADCVYEHPRLKLDLLRVKLEAVTYAESIEGHTYNITAEIREEVNRLAANIQAADEGRWADIRTTSMLKSDPIEWSKQYEECIDEAEHEAYSHLTDIPRGMGFCFAIWAEKRKALAKRGIEWQSPNQMNPGVMFD